MDLTPYTESLRQELLAVAGSGEATVPAERLAASVASATRLTLLDALSAAADEITREMATGSVEVRLRGCDPFFVVTPGDGETEGDGPAPNPALTAPVLTGRDGAISRINFRPPEQLKQRIEAAADHEGLSTNAWLVRVVGAALVGDQRRQRGRDDGQFIGWVG
ncbi:hypothetical protein [Embleya sp. AB8]|uniref:hypothetical protein n=1 Tax=Embleya sp. AB8 TaxID=3156304 RepID=UPI003C777E27